ncbi:Membrane-bound protease [uncultured archaeon]|nr:Membrane-bound protease [uncultured archaeon]
MASLKSPSNPFPAPPAPAKKVDFLAKAAIVAVALFVLGALAFGALLLVSGTSGINPSIGPPGGIAIIPLKGEISNDSAGSFSGQLTANDVVSLIDEAESDSGVGAILLDIDSPGGEAIASKQIVYRIRDSKKPVYSYINSTGASGAYYVAAATNHIMADPDSITGSIGVISMVPTFEGLMEKLGVKMNVLKEGAYKDIGSPYREMTDEDREIFQGVLSQIYSNFKADVLLFRQGKISGQSLESIADGRILTGKQALDKGLIDELVPSRKKAIQRAAELAGIKGPHEVHYGQREFSLMDLFFSAGQSFGSGFSASLESSLQQAAATSVKIR